MLVSAWNSASTKNFVNCFCKAGVSRANQEAAIAEDLPFKDLKSETDALRNVQPNLVPYDVNALGII